MEAKPEIKNPVKWVHSQQVIRTIELLTILGGRREVSIRKN